MRTHKITTYDEGQVLIKASDELFECASELSETQPELAERLFHMGCEIGTLFNKHGSHGFGLRGLNECKCRNCLGPGRLEKTGKIKRGTAASKANDKGGTDGSAR